MNERGRIYNAERASQLRDFSGLRYGTITPSDIDAIIDFGNRVFVIVETKTAGTPVPRGQRVLLERMADRINTGGARAAVFVAEHRTPTTQAIDVGSCIVVEVYIGAWRNASGKNTVKQSVDMLLEHFRISDYRKASGE